MALINIQKFRHSLVFYKNYLTPSTAITLCCAYIIKTYSIEAFFLVFWFKLITLTIFYTYITFSTSKKKEFFYYFNLGISKKHLWCTTLFLDLIIFLFAITFVLSND